MASESTILSWNVTNWITVILMVGVGFAALAFAMKLYQSKTQGS
jgi:hypothetical protein